MRYLFIINPVAGKGLGVSKIIPLVENYFKEHGGNYAVAVSNAPHETTDIARMEAMKGDALRIFACGGDGTLFDVVAGVYGYPHVEVGAIPCGSGNDFIKTFGVVDFLNMEGQVKGSSYPIDLIKFENHYSINVCSVGLDAEVVAHKNRLKFLSKISGTFSYNISILISFLFNIKNHFEIIIDGGEPFVGDYLFAVAANGRYYGGSYMPAPEASPHDGLMNCVLIKSVSRFKILTLLGKYKRGEHIKLKDICTHIHGEKMTIKADKPISVNLDGEIFSGKEVVFEIVKKGIKFVIPSYCVNKIEEPTLTGSLLHDLAEKAAKPALENKNVNEL